MRRLGLYLGRLPGFDKAGLDKSDLIECVRAADAAGYDSFWLPESWEREAFSTLTELATHTRSIGLCTGVINSFSRSPALIAMSAATLDEISGGRFRLGLGTSGAQVIEDFHGVPYHKSLTRLREVIQIVRGLLQGDRVDFDGDCFKLRRFKLGFKPIRTRIPIYVAALSAKSLRQAGELADGWIPTHWPHRELVQAVGEVRSAAESAGRDPSLIDIAPFINVVVDDDELRARQRARLPLAYYIGGMGKFYLEAVGRLGFAAEANLIQELWMSGKRKSALAAVTDAMVDAIAVCGPLEKCRSGIQALYSCGATLPIISLPGEGSTRDKIRIIEALSDA